MRSLRRTLLAQTADSMQLGMDSMEAFGQSEALTTRLKHIIDAYADGPGILLELVQNAGQLQMLFTSGPCYRHCLLYAGQSANVSKHCSVQHACVWVQRHFMPQV